MTGRSGRGGSLGLLLKQWRRLRGLSQLKLAVLAGVSSRHLSFVETGRSTPSRAFVLKLADTLQVPLADRNVILAAAGFAPAYAASALASTRLRPFRRAIARLLAQQEPYPAVLLDRSWNVVQTNRAAPRFFSQFIDLRATRGPRNLLRTLLAADGLHRHIENWPEVAGTLAQRVFREAPGGIPDAPVQLLLPALRQAQGNGPDGAGASLLPFHPVIFRHGKLRYSFFSMVTTVGAPVDITAEHLRLEAFFPADRRTEQYAQRFLA
jgi:transcriptional regulator with XRE-family HTH domain